MSTTTCIVLQVVCLKARLAKQKVKCVVLAWRKVARMLSIYKRSLARSKPNCFAEWRYQTVKQAMKKKAEQLQQNLSTRRCFCRHQLSTQSPSLPAACFETQLC